MKALIKISILVFLLTPLFGQAQFVPQKTTKKTTTLKKPTSTATVKPKVVTAKPTETKQTGTVEIRETKGCKSLPASGVSRVLTNRIANTLKVKLDKEDSYIHFNDNMQPFAISEYTVDKPGHNWKYFMNDVRSTGAEASFDEESRVFYLKVTFEGDGSEIKGRCPGCVNRYEDSRAPDINWLGDRQLILELKPIVHNNSIAFEVTAAKLKGHFAINGPVQAFLPGLVTYFERQIMSNVEGQAKRLMNTPSVRTMMSDAFRGTVNGLGLVNIDTVETGDNNLYICNN